MKFFAINGSPRKTFNTAKLLDKSLEGIKSILPEAEVRRIDLYDIPFNGCKSCFACKKVNGRHYGRCVYNDDFKPILNEITQADGLVLGSPVYFGDLTGNMRCFLERFMFPFLAYSTVETVEHKKMPISCIYTMNVSKKASLDMGYHDLFDKYESVLENLFTKPEHLYVYETYQFSDYDRYVSDMFDERERRHIHETRFPLDLQSSFKIGQNIAKRAIDD